MRCPSCPCLGSVCSRSIGRGSREVLSALYSRSSKARSTRPRMRGFEGWARHLRSGPATAAKPTFALTHPSNLRETIRLTTTPSSSFTGPFNCHSQSKSNSVTVRVATSPVRRWCSRVKRSDRCGSRRGTLSDVHLWCDCTSGFDSKLHEEHDRQLLLRNFRRAGQVEVVRALPARHERLRAPARHTRPRPRHRARRPLAAHGMTAATPAASWRCCARS